MARMMLLATNIGFIMNQQVVEKSDIIALCEPLLQKFKKADDEAKWSCPLPIGVFGTLRMHQGNNYLMTAGGKYLSHHKAFLPHYVAHGLSISFQKGASAVFEVFTYSPEVWKKMIGPVDRLEGFSPHRHYSDYGYHRTLVKMRLLPDDFKSPFYDGPRDSLLWGKERNLKIPMKDWDQYEECPAWVYSSRRQNSLCKETLGDNSPIIWDG